jgi:hypothetical protein
MKYGVFMWSEADGFKITGYDSERLQTFIADAVNQGRLFKGHWNERTWLGFTTLSRMVRECLKHFIAKGCSSWDVIVAKCLSITLVAALGARAGDVSRSYGYHNDEFLQWGYIRLYVDAESDIFPRSSRGGYAKVHERGQRHTWNRQRPLPSPT